MKKAQDLDEIEKKELFHLLIEHRTRIYENLARDALTLLSIQLFILPITVSLISFLFQVLDGRNGGEALQVLSDLTKNADTLLLQVGLGLGIAAILLTVIAYHAARGRASRQAKYLIQWHQPELLESQTVTGNLREKSEYFDQFSESIQQTFVEKHSDKMPDFGSEITQRPGSQKSGHTFLRSTITLAVLTTLASASLIVISLVQVIVTPVLAIFLTLLLVAIYSLIYGISLITILSLAEYAVTVGMKWIVIGTESLKAKLKNRIR